MTLGDKLPSGWAWAPLGDLLTGIDSGKSFKCEERPPLANEVGVVKVSAVSWGEYRERESKTCVDSHRVEPAYFIRPGDFLVSRANTIELVGAAVIVRRVTQPVMLSDKILRLHFAEDALKPWVLQYLRSAAGRQQIEQLASGNQESMRNIGQDRLKQIQIPLPPNLQRITISSKLDELVSDLAAAEVELSAAHRKLAIYRQALLKSAVEGALTAEWRNRNPTPESADQLLARIVGTRGRARALVEYPQRPLPVAWAWATIGELTLRQRYGTSAKTTSVVDGVPVLRMGNIQDGCLDFKNLKFLPLDHSEFPELFAMDGELLFNRTNSPELVGKCAVYRKQSRECSFASYLIGVQFVEGCVPEFVSAYINSSFGRDWVASVVSQQVGQANVNGSKLAALAIPVPPLDEQKEIVRVLGGQLAEAQLHSESIERALRLVQAQRQNILRAAFSGRLVPQDPNDEPASVMLERIHASKSAAAPANTKTKSRGRVKAATA